MARSQLQKHVRYWKGSAHRNWKTAQDLYASRHFDACLFFCHLTIEKYLKAMVVLRTKHAAPYTHDLILLAQLAEYTLTTEQAELLRTMTTFNISGRYDDYKFQFYKKATSRYTENYLQATRSFYLWLKKASSQNAR